MNCCIIIPARYDSTRFPGKPLHLINDAPLLFWTWQRAMRAGFPVFIASDDARIITEASGFGARVIKTGPANNGTERCALALAALGGGYDIVINWQGDAPLIPPKWAKDLADRLMRDMSRDVGTACYPCEHYEGVVAVARGDYPGGSTFHRPNKSVDTVMAHVGVYAMRADALRRYDLTPSRHLERERGLEQLRWPWVERVAPIFFGEFVPPPHPLREVNFPADVPIVAEALREIYAPA